MAEETYERPCELTTPEAQDLIRRFLTKEWKQLQASDISLFRLQSGMCNQVYIVERKVPPETSVPCKLEPRKVVVRKFGGNAAGDPCPELPVVPREAETLVVMECQRLGIGTKVYGVFEGGRLEEFVDSRHLTTEDMKSKDGKIRREVAIALAKFHGIDLPLPHPFYDYVDVLVAFQVGWDKVKKDYPSNAGVVRNKVDANRIVSYDFENELKWVRKLYSDDIHRHVLQHWDTQYSNILIRKESDGNGLNEKNGPTTVSQVCLIDVELVNYHIRGKDFGLLFSQQVLDFQKKRDKIGQFPPEEECYLFLKDYQDKVERLDFVPDFDAKGKDSLENLYLESLIGAMGSALFFLLYFLEYFPNFTQNDTVVVNTELMLDWYLHVKDILVKRFPHLAP